MVDDYLLRIAGEITFSNDVGGSLKKWREMFGVNQTELANKLGVTVSTVSDYESNRRKSPGIVIIRRFINGLIDLDTKNGSTMANKLKETKKDVIYDIHDFVSPVPVREFLKTINAEVKTGDDAIQNRKIYGYTLIDSVRAMLELPSDEFTKIYGKTSERALIFTRVSAGRSPMVAIRVTNLKPSVVVFHELKEVDKLAARISQIEKIPIAVTTTSIEDIMKNLANHE